MMPLQVLIILTIMKIMRTIKFNTPDGQYTLPLINVAEHRAGHYVKEGTQDYQDEINFVMEDDFEGIDWLLNNTDYEDWEDQTTTINSEVKVSMDEFWCSSDGFEIIETD